MSLGVLLLGKKQPKVLVLGLAGASVVRGVLALNPRSEFVGVEIDAEVVATSLEWFDLAMLPVKIEISDAARKESQEIVNDLIIAAYNNAKENLKKKSAEELSKVTGGLNLPLDFKMPF